MDKMMFKEELKRRNMTVTDFAKLTNNSVTTMYRKINESDFTNSDLKKAIEIFGIKKVSAIFFEK